MMDSIRWCIIGVGEVTEVKSGPALQQARDSSIVNVMRRTADRAADYADRHQIPKWTHDADELINDPDVNAVYIAAPPHTHLDYVRRVAAAGKPIYIEKPMGRNHAECQAMLEACQQANVPLYVAYYRRALPRFLKIKDLVDHGMMGEIRLVNLVLTMRPPKRPYRSGSLPWRLDPELSPGGLFLDLACHQLDFLDFLFGPIVKVDGHAANLSGYYPNVDTVSARFEFENGVQGTGLWSFDAFRYYDQIEIIGTQATVKFSIYFDDQIEIATPPRLPNKLARLLRIRQSKSRELIMNPIHVQQPLIQTVVDELLGRGVCQSTGESAARTNWVMDQMVTSYLKPE